MARSGAWASCWRLCASALVPEIELGVHEQREAELARDRLRVGAVEDQLGGLLPSGPKLTLLGQSKHVTDGVGDGAQRTAVCGGQRLGEPGGEIAGRQGHRVARTQNLSRICDGQRREAIRRSLPAGLVEECRDGEHDEDQRQTDDRDGVALTAMHAALRAASLDHLVGAGGQAGRHFQAERFGGFQVDQEFEFGGLIDRQVGGGGAIENASHADSSSAIIV